MRRFATQEGGGWNGRRGFFEYHSDLINQESLSQVIEGQLRGSGVEPPQGLRLEASLEEAYSSFEHMNESYGGRPARHSNFSPVAVTSGED